MRAGARDERLGGLRVEPEHRSKGGARGNGLLGLFLQVHAHHLQQQGHRVTLIDAWGPANSRASSGGESRLTRAAYGKDAIYTRMAMDSLPQWKALSAVSGLPIFIPAGILFFFATEEPYVRDSIAAHREFGLPTDVLTQAEMARRFPMIDFDGISVGLYEPGFGALMARRAVLTLVDRFVRDGGTYAKGSALPPAGADRLDQAGGYANLQRWGAAIAARPAIQRGMKALG